jgi:hypothetical protein
MYSIPIFEQQLLYLDGLKAYRMQRLNPFGLSNVTGAIVYPRGQGILNFLFVFQVLLFEGSDGGNIRFIPFSIIIL